MKKFLVLIVIAFGLVASHATFAASQPFTATTNQTSTDFTINYTYVGTPTQTLNIYSWLTNTATGVYVNQNNLVETIPASSTQVTKTFSVDYNFAHLGLTAGGTKYAYYLADGTTSSANLLYGAANFTVGTAPTPTFTFTATGQYAGQAAGTYQEGFTVAPQTALTDPMTLTLNVYNSTTPSTVASTSSVIISAGSTATVSPGTDDLSPGTYTANLLSGTTNVGTVSFNIVSALPPVVLQLSSVMAPATTVTIKGTLTATPTDIPNGHLVLEVGSTPGLLTDTTVAYSGDIPPTGVSFTVTSDALDPTIQTQYYFQFVETTTNTNLSSGSFVLNTPTDQVSGPAAPTSPGTGTNTPVEPSCATGPFTTSTPTSSLCSTGTISNLANSTSNWTWSCNGSIPYQPVSCSATVTGTATNPTTPSGTTTTASNFLQNPLSSSLNTFPAIIAAVMNNIVLPIMIPFIAIMIIYCGFLFVIARKRGSTDGYAAAKKTLMYTIIGAALVLGATVIANALQGTLNSLLAPSSTTTTAAASTPATTATSIISGAAGAVNNIISGTTSH